VRVVDGRIAGIGDVKPLPDERTIDAGGLVLAPGFIDPHNHSTEGLLTEPDAASQISQGITTLVVGQDGSSPWPIKDYLDKLHTSPPSVNVLTAVGHATVRQLVMGDDYKRAARPDEVAKMEALVAQGMREGAVALSSGLEYEVGSYSTTDEVVALARVAGREGGFYISHTRDEPTNRSTHAPGDRHPTRNCPCRTPIKLGTVGVWRQATRRCDMMCAPYGMVVDHRCSSSKLTTTGPSRGLADWAAQEHPHRTPPITLRFKHGRRQRARASTPVDLATSSGQRRLGRHRDGGRRHPASYGGRTPIFSSDSGIGVRHPRGADLSARAGALRARAVAVARTPSARSLVPAARLSWPTAARFAWAPGPTWCCSIPTP
jgi:hypothetical protein